MKSAIEAHRRTHREDAVDAHLPERLDILVGNGAPGDQEHPAVEFLGLQGVDQLGNEAEVRP